LDGKNVGKYAWWENLFNINRITHAIQLTFGLIKSPIGKMNKIKKLSAQIELKIITKTNLYLLVFVRVLWYISVKKIFSAHENQKENRK